MKIDRVRLKAILVLLAITEVCLGGIMAVVELMEGLE